MQKQPCNRPAGEQRALQRTLPCLARLQGADDPAGVAYRQAVGRDVLGDYAASANDAVIADGDPRQDQGAGADPHIVPNGHRVGVFQPGQTLLHVHGVLFCDNADVRGNKHVVANGDFAAVHELAVDIEKKLSPTVVL